MKFFAKHIAVAALAASALCVFNQASATAIIDSAGDFLGSYTGPHNGDLDVTSADVILNGANFILLATVNGNVGTTANSIYVFGFDKGGATNAPFANLTGNGVTDHIDKVIFNAAVVVNGTTGAVTLGALNLGTAVINGNSISATIAASALTSTGSAFSDYLWNLWPRAPAGIGGTQVISDFAPNNAMVKVSVPEPASAMLFGLGLLSIGFMRRRKA